MVRSLGTHIVSEAPGETISMDYVKMGLSRSGLRYVLIMVCTFSRFVMLVPATAATVVTPSETSCFGIVSWDYPRESLETEVRRFPF